MLDSSTMDYGCVVSKWWSIFSPLLFPHLPNFLIFNGCKKNTCPYLVLFKFKKSHKNKVYVTSEQQDQSFTNFHGDQFKHNNHNNHHNNPNLGWIMGLGQMSSCTSKSKDASKGLRVSSRGQRWKIMDGTMVHIHGYLGDAPFRDVAMLEL